MKVDDILNKNIVSTCSHVEVEERYPDIERIWERISGQPFSFVESFRDSVASLIEGTYSSETCSLLVICVKGNNKTDVWKLPSVATTGYHVTNPMPGLPSVGERCLLPENHLFPDPKGLKLKFYIFCHLWYLFRFPCFRMLQHPLNALLTNQRSANRVLPAGRNDSRSRNSLLNNTSPTFFP